MGFTDLPTVIQGGMGVAVSSWRLARAVSTAGQLGVVAGSGLAERAFDGHVDPERRCGDREPCAQLGRVHAGHLELDGGDGIARDAHDAVDVAAVVSDDAGDAGHRGGPERMTQHRHVAAPLGPSGVVAVAGNDVDLHAQGIERVGHRSADRGFVTVAGSQQDAEDQIVASGVPLGLVRLAAGTEDTDDLVADVLAAADAVAAEPQTNQ